jgi:hypothetical protein
MRIRIEKAEFPQCWEGGEWKKEWRDDVDV